MKRVEVTVEVGPIARRTVEKLKRDGYEVFHGYWGWRVQATIPVLGPTSASAQAHVVAANVIREYSLDTLTDPPVFVTRDPDAGFDERPDLVLRDARRADDPEPLRQLHLKWYQHDLGLDLRERRRG